MGGQSSAQIRTRSEAMARFAIDAKLTLGVSCLAESEEGTLKERDRLFISTVHPQVHGSSQYHTG